MIEANAKLYFVGKATWWRFSRHFSSLPPFDDWRQTLGQLHEQHTVHIIGISLSRDIYVFSDGVADLNYWQMLRNPPLGHFSDDRKVCVGFYHVFIPILWAYRSSFCSLSFLLINKGKRINAQQLQMTVEAAICHEIRRFYFASFPGFLHISQPLLIPFWWSSKLKDGGKITLQFPSHLSTYFISPLISLFFANKRISDLGNLFAECPPMLSR